MRLEHSPRFSMVTGGIQSGLRHRTRRRSVLKVSLAGLALCVAGSANAQAPSLDAIFPAGGQAGQVANVTVHGSQLERLTSLRCSMPGVRCEPNGAGQFQLTI